MANATDAELLRELERGGAPAWDQFLRENRARLVRMIAVRMDRRLKGRLDASDVIQDAYAEAHGRLAEYLKSPSMPPNLWLRFLVGQRLLLAARQHLGTAARDAGREQGWPESTADGLAAHLVDRATGPDVKAEKQELYEYLRAALASLDAGDREVLTLRHFEQLTNAEVAGVLRVEPAAASKRYVRALDRLHTILSARPELLEVLQR
ncbi:MAG TPA: sigma-70 family RNA polymerase sigma factor [Gemmataceae bacterium]|nr:sigma-70 family RNA polymerase sigma factor [Gemmataceae bacterium]